VLRRRQKSSQVIRITGARQSLADDVRGRQRRYVISMLIRTASVLLTVFLWNVQRPLAVVTLVLGGLLPYVAVVIANAGRERPPGLPSTFVAGPTRPVLGPAEPAERPADGTTGRPADGTTGRPAEPGEGRAAEAPEAGVNQPPPGAR
jgi:hypothetical protein